MHGSRRIARRSKVMTVRLLAAILLLTWSVPPPHAQAESLPSTSPERVGLSADRLARIGRALEGEVAKGTLPGPVASALSASQKWPWWVERRWDLATPGDGVSDRYPLQGNQDVAHHQEPRS